MADDEYDDGTEWIKGSIRTVMAKECACLVKTPVLTCSCGTRETDEQVEFRQGHPRLHKNNGTSYQNRVKPWASTALRQGYVNQGCV